MPLIVDANRAGDFCTPVCGHAGKIVRFLTTRAAKLVVGGKLTQELCKNANFRTFLLEMQRVGSLISVEAAKCEAEISELRSYKSNDPHVLALARVSGARLLYTDDRDLMTDFKDRALICPRGKVITPGTHEKVAVCLVQKFGT